MEIELSHPSHPIYKEIVITTKFSTAYTCNFTFNGKVNLLESMMSCQFFGAYVMQDSASKLFLECCYYLQFCLE